jgi:putative oxidoreductase
MNSLERSKGVVMNSMVMSLVTSSCNLYYQFEQLLQRLIPVANLVMKLWVANVFFKAGLTKIESFDTTIMLFSYEYNVPLLSPVFAAYLGTAAELILPVMLVIGLAGRFSAAALFVFNIVAVISYPDISDAGIRDHVVWGIMLFIAMAQGSGTLSLDYLIKHHFCKINGDTSCV